MFTGLETAGADFDASAFWQASPLEIKLPSSFAGLIKLSSANTVGVSSA